MGSGNARQNLTTRSRTTGSALRSQTPVNRRPNCLLNLASCSTRSMKAGPALQTRSSNGPAATKASASASMTSSRLAIHRTTSQSSSQRLASVSSITASAAHRVDADRRRAWARYASATCPDETASTCWLTLEVSGRCHELHEDTAPIRSGPLERIVRTVATCSSRATHEP